MSLRASFKLSSEVCAPASADEPRSRRQERRSEEHTSELQSQSNLVCRLLLEKKKKHAPTAVKSQPNSLKTKHSLAPSAADPHYLAATSSPAVPPLVLRLDLSPQLRNSAAPL